MNALTIIAGVYLLISMIRGYKKGLAGTFLSMFFLVLVIITTSIFAPSMTRLFSESQNVTAYFDKKCAQIIESNTVGSTDGLNVGPDASAGEVATAAIQLALSIAGVRSIDVNDMTAFLIRLTAMAVTFILSCIAWIIIRIVLSRIRKMKGIGTIDRLLGIPVGALRGLITIWIVLCMISLLSFTGIGAKLAGLVQESPYLMFLSRYNLITMMIAKFVVGAL